MSEMCCRRLDGNTGRKNYAKITHKKRHLRTIAQLCRAVFTQLSEQEGQHPLTGQRAANFRLLANQ